MATAKSSSTQQAVIPAASASVVSTSQVDIHGTLPDLRKVEVKPVDLALDYWTPAGAGESKTLIFMRVQSCDEIPDFNDPAQTVTRDCAYFIEQTDQGYRIIRNASSRLVSLARHFLEGQVYHITFQGLRPNKTNSNKSHYWAIQPVTLAS